VTMPLEVLCVDLATRATRLRMAANIYVDTVLENPGYSRKESIALHYRTRSKLRLGRGTSNAADGARSCAPRGRSYHLSLLRLGPERPLLPRSTRTPRRANSATQALHRSYQLGGFSSVGVDLERTEQTLKRVVVPQHLWRFSLSPALSVAQVSDYAAMIRPINKRSLMEFP
jgi:hypothetical protein